VVEKIWPVRLDIEFNVREAKKIITKARKIENTKKKFADGRANLIFRFLFRAFVISFE